MANLIKRKLNFKESFYGFNLKVEFMAQPRVENPKSLHDYECDFVSLTTTHESVDVHLLAGAIGKINDAVSIKIQEKVHGLYMAEQLAQEKWERNLYRSSTCEHSDAVQANC